MATLDVLKFLEYYGDETDLADYTVEELEEMLERMKNGDDPLPMTREEFKRKYFEFYDDVKDKTLKKQDW